MSGIPANRIYVGFSEGRPDHTRVIDTGFGGFGELRQTALIGFKNKRDALKQYQDVRLMELVEVGKVTK